VARGGTGVSTPFAQGSILFAGPGGVYQSSSSFRWDDSGARLGIGTTQPAYRLDVQGDVGLSGDLHAGGTVQAAGFSGNLTGNVAGNLVGNVTGDVDGNLTGNVLGNVTGNLAGNVSGNLSGTVTGRLNGYAVLTDVPAAEPGAIRYVDGHFQGYDGTRWTQLDNAPAPSVTSVDPSSGPSAGGTRVTIAGANFSAQALVTVGGAGCTVEGMPVTTSIVCITPPGSIGSTTVVVVNPDSQNGQKVNGFTYAAPIVSSVTPSSGPTAGGTLVTVAGQHFHASATVTVGGTACPLSGSVAADGTSLRCTTPAGSAGAATAAVKNPDNATGQKTGAFTYIPPPSVGAVSPSSGTSRGGTVVTITGSNFASSTVTVGGRSATGVSVASGQITLTTPYSAAPGNATILVVNGDAQQATGTFNYRASGESAALAAASCKAIRDAGGSIGSGTYWLIPDGSTTFEAYCDMSGAGGGWTLVMKLSSNQFCYGSGRWTDSSALNEANLLTATLPNQGQYDAKSRAFWMLSDATSLRFVTDAGEVSASFVSASSPRTLMTTNSVAFSAYPDYGTWRAAFGQDRSGSPFFMRAGSGSRGLSGCGKPCTFCYQALDPGPNNDVNSGMGQNSEYCGGGNSDYCSTGGSWSSTSRRTAVYAR